MDNAELIARGERVLMKNCRRQPVVLVRGRGARVEDADGRSYLDLVSGVAVNAFGHAPGFLAEVLAAQANELIHVSNLYYSAPLVEAAERLTGLAGMERVFFCNSGAEAVEAAIKLARKYGRTKRGGRYEIVTARRSFHGRTMGALTATGQEKYQRDFVPLVPGFRYAPFNDLAAWREAVTPATCALMIEPVQAEGGIHPARPEFVRGLAELAEEHGLLLIFDEVQTGLGRTGKLFAWQHFGVKPHIMTLAKGLGGGFPVGALLAREEAAVFAPGDHQSTFGGNPLACTAALATLEYMLENGVAENAARVGAYFKARLLELAGKFPFITEVRGLGLLLGMELTTEGAPIVTRCRERGLLINCVDGRILRFLPPLIIETEEVDTAAGILKEVFREALKQC